MKKEIFKGRTAEALILALGLVILGLCIKGGINDFANKDRKVSVKGLAEREVDADKVTWPIVLKESGDNLPELYERIGSKKATVKNYLISKGINAKEISESAPKVNDLKTDQYSDQHKDYRYLIASTLTVTSKNVKLVREIMAQQGELLKEGIAVFDGGYENPVRFEYVSFTEMKPKMMEEAIANAEKTAQQFAKNSHSKLNKIISADQGQFSIESRDENTPYIKKVRVVTTVTYSLKN